MGVSLTRGKSFTTKQNLDDVEKQLISLEEKKLSKLHNIDKLNINTFKKVLGLINRSKKIIVSQGYKDEKINDTLILKTIYPKFIFECFGNKNKFKKLFIQIKNFINQDFKQEQFKFINKNNKVGFPIIQKEIINNLFAITERIDNLSKNIKNFYFYKYSKIEYYFLQKALLEDIYLKLNFQQDIPIFDLNNLDESFAKISSDKKDILKVGSEFIRDNSKFREEFDEVIKKIQNEN